MYILVFCVYLTSIGVNSRVEKVLKPMHTLRSIVYSSKQVLFFYVLPILSGIPWTAKFTKLLRGQNARKGKPSSPSDHLPTEGRQRERLAPGGTSEGAAFFGKM